jgi:hypothetical protein
MEMQTDKRVVAENRKRGIPIHKTCKMDMQIYATVLSINRIQKIR